MFALWGNVIYSTRMLHFLVVFRGMRWPRDAILWKQCLRTIAEHMTACGLLCCFYDPCFKSHVARDDILFKVINQVIIEGRRKRRKQRKFWMMTLQNGQDVIFSHLRTLPRSESGGRLWFLRLSSTPLRCTTRVTRRHDAMFLNTSKGTFLINETRTVYWLLKRIKKSLQNIAFVISFLFRQCNRSKCRHD